MQRWLVISNCNRKGLQRSLQQLCPSVAIDEVHMRVFERRIDDGSLRLDDYARMFVNPQLRTMSSDTYLSRLHDVLEIPSLFFCGYHPDACNVRVDGKAMGSPVGPLHSAICVTAFKKGVPAGEVEDLFCAETYERAGYFDVWDNDRALEFAKFAEHGIDLADLFPAWSRAGPFMYTFQHPVISCIHDTVRLVLRAAGLPHLDTPYRPVDDLRAMGSFPIYPEIGERCGVPGTIHFERGNTSRLISLRDFIARSYRNYQRIGADKLVIQQDRWERFERLQTMIG